MHSSAPLWKFGGCEVSGRFCLDIVSDGGVKGFGFEDAIFGSSMHRMCVCRTGRNMRN